MPDPTFAFLDHESDPTFRRSAILNHDLSQGRGRKFRKMEMSDPTRGRKIPKMQMSDPTFQGVVDPTIPTAFRSRP